MTVYTVHQPRPRKGEVTADPERFVFVRDGFYFWAFLLGPLWMLWHRLWLVLILYLVITTGLQAALWALGMAGGIKLAVGFLIALLVGFEAATLRRWTLGRRGWNNVGLVVASDLDSAERRFFDSWVTRRPSPPATPPPPPAAPPVRIPPSAPDVVGLFPQPDARR